MMISFLKTRIAASLITMAAVLHPHACNAAPTASVVATPAQLDHISIAKVGKGSPVILIPGLSTPSAVWDGVVPYLAKRHSVYLVQVNGFGGGDPRGNLTPGIIDGVVGDLDRYIVTNHLTNASVVGHSLGGLIGLDLARKHPTDIGKLMVIDALPYIGDIFLPGATVAQVQPQAAMMRDRTIASYGKPANPEKAKATANSLAIKLNSRAKVAAWVSAADARVTGQALYEDMTTDLRPDMAAIATPITLVYPWSEAMPKDRADAFYRTEYAKAPTVTFVPIGESAHFVMLDQPVAFSAALQKFVDGKR